MFQGAPGTQMRTIAHRWKRLDTVVPMNPNSGMSHANSKINLRITSNAVDSFALPDPETRGFHIQFKKTCTEINYNCIYFHLKKLQLGPIDAAFQKLQYALKNNARANFFFFPSFSNVFSTVFTVDLSEKSGDKSCHNFANN